MERLTEISGDEVIPNQDKKVGYKACMRKLSALEDLEEQIGMPLDVAIQILMNGVVYVVEEKRYCNVLSFVNKTIKDGVTVFTYRSRANFETRLYSDSYGVKWFLSREEAEKKMEEKKND